jgi:hypothetical protein
MTIKSKAWIDYSSKIDEVLQRMYDTDALGSPLHQDSPELLDPINRIANTQIDFNGYMFSPIPSHIAKRIVLDELENRKKRKDN